MNIEGGINKFSFLLKKNKLNLFLLVIVTIAYYLYLSAIVIPYGTKFNILTDENTLPAQGKMPEYIMLSYPTYLIYILISFGICIKTNFIRGIIYPILLHLYFGGSVYCVMSHGVEYIWLYILTYPILLSISIIFAIFGLILDIKTYKTTIMPDDYNIYENISTTLSKWQSKFLKVFCFIKNICLKVWNYFTENIEK